MKITASEISYDVSKALGASQANAFQMEDITPALTRSYVKPGLLTALLAPQQELLLTDTFKFDRTDSTVALPDGKSYMALGNDIAKDRPKQYLYSVPSFGIKFNVAPGDYANRRKPGTNELMQEADVVAAMTVKADDAWALFEELAIAQLVTADTNIVRGGPFTVYNFHTELEGGARAAATDMNLDGANIDFYQTFREQRRLLTQTLQRAGDSASQIVCVCGDTFFDLRYAVEQKSGLAREIKFGLDLASQPISESSFGAGTYNYAYFDSMDGIRYINYGSEIIAGQKLIGDADAYLIPLGARNLIRSVYAPAQTREYVNTQAMKRYAWSMVDNRQGVTVIQESNFLPALLTPAAIRHLTTT